MNTSTFTALFLAFALAFGGGCHGAAVYRPAPGIASAPVLAAQQGKDVAVLASASRIDAVAPAVRPQTDEIRAAVAAAPATQVASLIKDYDAARAGDAKALAVSEARAKAAEEATDNAVIIGGYALVALLILAGVGSFAFQAQLAFLGAGIGWAAFAAAGVLFGLLRFYQFTRDHPWITGLALAPLLVAAGLAVSNHFHAKGAKA